VVVHRMNMLSKIRNCLKAVLYFITICLIYCSASSQSFTEPDPLIDWQERITNTQRLSTLGNDLMGDQIDYNSGALSFVHTDISIPGNNDLSVAVSRRITSGLLYDKSSGAEFGDWEIIVPRISAITATETNFRTGNRCSDPVQFQEIDVELKGGPNHPYYNSSRRPSLFGYEYSSGLSTDTAEFGKEDVQNVRNLYNIYGASTRYVTRSHFKISCLSNIEGGGEGFLAVAPDGTTYSFDKFYEIRAEDQQFSNLQDAYAERFRSIVAATEVTDVHGNWVKYEYNEHNQLIRIHSSDGRNIDITYDNANSPISEVTANNRIWSYDYEIANTRQSYQEWAFGQSLDGQEYYTLSKVTLPDDRFWDLHLEAFSLGQNPEGCTPDFGGTSGGPLGISGYTISMTHPSGVTGSFSFADVRRRIGLEALESKSVISTPGFDPEGSWNQFIANGTSVTLACAPLELFNQDLFPDTPDVQDTLAALDNQIASARIEIKNILTDFFNGINSDPFFKIHLARSAIDQAEGLRLVLLNRLMAEGLQAPPDDDVYGRASLAALQQTGLANLLSYRNMRALTIKSLSGADIPDVDVDNRTNWTKITGPENNITTHYFHWDDQEFGSELKKTEYRNGDDVLLQTQSFEHVKQAQPLGFPFRAELYMPTGRLYPVHTSKTEMKRDGDTYTQAYDYELHQPWQSVLPL